MMNIEQQLQILIDNAEKNGVSVVVMEKAIAPILKEIAQRLNYLQYYILQSPERNWIVTTLSHRENPQLEKKVIYAFVTPEDAQQFQGVNASDIKLEPFPSTHLLLQLFALKPVDSLIFLDNSGNLDQGKEIQRLSLEQLITEQLKSLSSESDKQIPPNVC